MGGGNRSVAFARLVLLVACIAGAVVLAPVAMAQTVPEPIFLWETLKDGATVFGIVQVKGYILDYRGVSNVTLLIDGDEVHSAEIYQVRGDVQKKYPNFFGGDWLYDPGFVTSFLVANYDDGEHTVAIQVTYADVDFETGEQETVIVEERTLTFDSTINQPPLGGLDTPRDPELWGEQDIVSGVYPITGWAIDDQAIRTTTAADGKIRADIDVMVDGRVVGQALWGLPRPDVAIAHPDVPAALKSGFHMNLNTARITNGPHRISVRAWDTVGKTRVLGTRQIWVDNHYATLMPFGKIDWPNRNGHLYTRLCSSTPLAASPEYPPADHNDWVAGWVVDQNDNARFEGVAYVELLLDGALLKSSKRDCAFDPGVFLMDTDCYGKERLDVEYAYPQFDVDAKQSGFFFGLNVKRLFDLGISRGLHYLAIRVGTLDPTRPPVIVDEIPVLLDCTDDADEPSFGDLESPVAKQAMKGSELLKGWVVDLGGVVTLNVYVDGILDGSLTGAGNPNLHAQRNDVVAKFPWIPSSLTKYSGFQFTLDTTKYTDGTHQLVLETIDGSGFRAFWVQRAVSFDNLN
jgi:hypothetical protein